MFKANVAEVKARLSDYLERVERGERIVICRRNTPIAELRSIAATRATPRPIGPLPGRPIFDVPQSFFEPMPADELDLWDQLAPNDLLGAATRPARARKLPTSATKVRAAKRRTVRPKAAARHRR